MKLCNVFILICDFVCFLNELVILVISDRLATIDLSICCENLEVVKWVRGVVVCVTASCEVTVVNEVIEYAAFNALEFYIDVDLGPELLEHLNWFFYREKGKYQLTVEENRIVLEVFECPAIRHLKKLGLAPSPYTCLQTIEVNAGMCEDTPWHSEVQIKGEGHCVQIFTRDDVEKIAGESK